MILLPPLLLKTVVIVIVSTLDNWENTGLQMGVPLTMVMKDPAIRV